MKQNNLSKGNSLHTVNKRIGVRTAPANPQLWGVRALGSFPMLYAEVLFFRDQPQDTQKTIDGSGALAGWGGGLFCYVT